MEITTEKPVPVNELIRAREVRVIGPEGEQLGILGVKEAIAAAMERGLDLVEVASTATPPVCRIMDFGKYKYQQNKKAQLAKKKQKIIQVKEIKVRPKTDRHDLEVKAKHAKRFLSEGNKIKVTVRFRGREIVHADRGQMVLDQLLEMLAGSVVIEAPAKLEGKNMIMVLAPSGH